MIDQISYIHAFKTNDNHVIQKFYKENYPVVRTVIARNFPVLKDDDIKDIFQEGVIALWSNIKDDVYVHQENVKLSTYLVQICKFKCMDRLKKKSFQMESVWEESIDFGEADIHHTSEDEEVIKLRALVASMPDRCRNLLTYFYFEEKKLQEIAQILGIGEASIKNEKYRCMQKLKEYFSKK